MTSIPRPRQTQDHELLIIARVCDLLATLALEPRKRAVDYINARWDNLRTIAAVPNGPDQDDGDGELFDREPAQAAGG